MTDIKDMTIREIETKLSRYARLARKVDLYAASAIANHIEEYLTDAIGDYIFGERELGHPYVNIETLVAAVMMAEPELPTSMVVSTETDPSRAVLSYADPIRTYSLRESQFEYQGKEWLVECKRPKW